MFKTIFSYGSVYNKREICVLRQSKPTPTNRDLAISFKVRENTVCDILKRRSEYLAINPEDPNSHNKRLRKGKYSGLEDGIRSVRSSILLYKSSLVH
ncbi:7167_t:CDS:2 [Entrophospora sp. SA101]|nr:7167_t:CDS:2 [Entrophospora sp. SA101]